MYGMKKPAKPKLIKGPGTGTSDSIQKEVPEGTYIMPADSTQALGATKPKGKPAPQQTHQIGVSNGEMELPPEAVQQLGAAVLDQVRNATHTPVAAGFKPKAQREQPEMYFADGGLVDDEERRRNPVAGYAANVKRNQEAMSNAAEGIKTAASYTAPALGYRAARAVGGKVADVVTGRDPITIDSNLPDYGAGERQRAAQKFVRTQPEQAAAATEYGAQVAERTLNNGLAPRGGYPGITRPDTEQMAAAEQQAAEAEQQAQQAKAGGQQATGPVTDSPNEWGNLGYGGIVGRRNKDGVQEFSNMQGDVAAAGDRQFNGEGSTVGDGKGQVSTLTGFGANTENYRRAAEISAQTRLERQNPNYLTVVRDSGAGGVRGLVNRQLNDRDTMAAGERSRQHQQDVAAGRQRLADSGQQDIQNQQTALEQQWAIDDRAVATEDRDRLRALRDQMMDTSLDAAQRIEARRQYMALTVDAGDRYKAESVQYGTDADGKPVLGNRLVDVTSGEFVTGEQAAPARRSVSQAEVEETARARGVPVDQVIKQLSDIGVTVDRA